jgi:hypothetical protein
MLVQQVALVAEPAKIVKASTLSKVSAALQKQVVRDLAPIWGVKATVDSFASLDDVPLGYWPIVVVRDVPDAAGLHTDKDGQPIAFVELGDTWSLSASHECLEMLVDPFGNRLVAGRSPVKRQGRVEFLVEVCDPCEDATFAYTSNGVLVSDFYTPHYFDPMTAPNVRYSFTGALTMPRQVLQGGYLSWHDPKNDHWYQWQEFGDAKNPIDLGKFPGGMSLRAWVNRHVPQATSLSHAKSSSPASKLMAAASGMSDASSESKAAAWREMLKGAPRARRG